MASCFHSAQIHNPGFPFQESAGFEYYANQQLFSRGRTITTCQYMDESSKFLTSETYQIADMRLADREADKEVDIQDEVTNICLRLQSSSINEESDYNGNYSGVIIQQDDLCVDGPTEKCVADAKTIYVQDSDGDTLLHVAVILQNVEEAVSFVNIAPRHEFLSIKNDLLQAPLHLAVLTNQAAVSRRLVVGGADVASRDKDGNTSLHLACREGYVHLIDILLEPVSDIEKTQNNYELPHQNIQQILDMPNYEGLPCVHLAAMNGHLDIVKQLINRGADINSIDGKTGRTLLHKAAIDGNVELVKLLLSSPNCDINARAFNDYTPFNFARERGHHEITFEIAAAGSRIAKDSYASENLVEDNSM